MSCHRVVLPACLLSGERLVEYGKQEENTTKYNIQKDECGCWDLSDWILQTNH